MNSRLSSRTLMAGLAILLAVPAAAQPPQISPAQRAHLLALGAALGQCHRAGAARLARTRLTPAQIADRVIAACAGREVPMRSQLVHDLGPQRAEAALTGQRPHWRQTIARIVTEQRARG
jgi:hypothetical protein